MYQIDTGFQYNRRKCNIWEHSNLAKTIRNMYYTVTISIFNWFRYTCFSCSYLNAHDNYQILQMALKGKVFQQQVLYIFSSVETDSSPGLLLIFYWYLKFDLTIKILVKMHKKVINSNSQMTGDLVISF